MFKANEILSVEAAHVEAVQLVHSLLMDHILAKHPALIKDALPPGYNYSDHYHRFRPLTGSVCYRIHTTPTYAWADALGEVSLSLTTRTIKGHPHLGYVASGTLKVERFLNARTAEAFSIVEQDTKLPLNPDWLINVNEFITTNLDVTALSAFELAFKAHLASLTMPVLLPTFKPFVMPDAWKPVYSKPVLDTIAETCIAHFPMEKLNDRTIAKAGYSADHSRLILFFTDDTQMVIPISESKNVLYRKSSPTPFGSSTPAVPPPVQEFDPFAL